MAKKINYELRIVIGERLKSLRLENNFTKEELAKKINVNKITIDSWEKGKTSPSLKYLIKICELYHVSSDYIFFNKKGSKN